jgi:peptidoglycan-N-acetylglucosamine deacetylase
MKWWLLFTLIGLKAVGAILVWGTDWKLVGGSVFFAGSLVVLWHHLAPRAQGLCDVIEGFVAEGRQVWLTIDDGPDVEDTPRILDLLDEYGAKATFFMIGEKAAGCPDLVRMVVTRGHGVGCHTFSHPLRNFWCAGRARVCREIDDSLMVLRDAGAQVWLYRSPAGIKNIFLRRCLRERNLACVAWSVRSGDGVSKSLDRVVRRVLREVRPGSILLMHEGINVAREVRVEGLRGVLRGLRERGFTCVVPGCAASTASMLSSQIAL